MSKKKEERQERQEQREPETTSHTVDKRAIIAKLETLAQETGDIAGYIDETVRYGRALGYVEGKQTAYVEIAYRILEGEFDLAVDEDGRDGYE